MNKCKSDYESCYEELRKIMSPGDINGADLLFLENAAFLLSQSRSNPESFKVTERKLLIELIAKIKRSEPFSFSLGV